MPLLPIAVRKFATERCLRCHWDCYVTVDHGWTPAGELAPGDEVYTSQGGWVRVTSATWTAERTTVYNFEVEGFHTYFVGESAAWVHNRCDTFSDTRRGAFRTAKRSNDIPMNAEPDAVLRPGEPGAEHLRRGSNVREYHFTNRHGERIAIREDLPVNYSDGGSQGPHFNSGPVGGKLKEHHYWGGEK